MTMTVGLPPVVRVRSIRRQIDHVAVSDTALSQHRPVLASGCLPFKMRAPEISGEHYWDGGFMGNPAIFPVIYECDSCDVLLVPLTPTERAELPTDSLT